MTPLLAPRLRPDRAFERIYRRHVGDVYRYALAMLRNPADAEDVTQTTFLNAYRAFERGERPRAPQNWLITIAHNVCRQRFRQSQRRVQEVTLSENLADDFVADEDDTPTIRDIQRALGHLAFNQRSALVMREMEGRSYLEIAQILDLSTSAVETLLFRARRALREQLDGGLTCREAELAISRQLDGRLERPDRGPLRAHLRECTDCAALARRQRAQRAAIKALGAVPLPSSLSTLASLFGGGAAGGAATVGSGVAAKAAAVAAAGLLVGGVGYEGAGRLTQRPAEAAAEEAVGAAAAQSPPARVRALGQLESSVENASVGKAQSVQKTRGRQGQATGMTAAPGNASGKPDAPGHGKKPARGKAFGKPDFLGAGKRGGGKPGYSPATKAGGPSVELAGTPQGPARGPRTSNLKEKEKSKKGTPGSHPPNGNGGGQSGSEEHGNPEKKGKSETKKPTGPGADATKKLETDPLESELTAVEKDEKSPPGAVKKDELTGSVTTATTPSHEPPGQSDEHGKDKDKGKEK